MPMKQNVIINLGPVVQRLISSYPGLNLIQVSFSVVKKHFRGYRAGKNPGPIAQGQRNVDLWQVKIEVWWPGGPASEVSQLSGPVSLSQNWRVQDVWHNKKIQE